MIAIIPNKKIYFTISIMLFVLSIVCLSAWGLKFGIDFTGGSLWEVEFLNERPSNEKIVEVMKMYKAEDVFIQPTGEKGAIIKFRDINENTHQDLKQNLNSVAPLTEKKFESIGPTIGKELQTKSVKALMLVLVLIVAYIAFAFRKVSRPVASWKYGIAAIIALLHDIIIPVGVFSALGHFKGVEIDSFFITAILTVLGFSVHDTIVVFDRIRENLKKNPSLDFSVNINNSVNETMARSINTSLTVFLVLISVYFLGGESTKNMTLALILGVLFGTYSSIFIASPIIDLWAKSVRKSR
jgi:preprotein translocase subunit SecF